MFGIHFVSFEFRKYPSAPGRGNICREGWICCRNNNFSLLFLFNRACENISLCPTAPSGGLLVFLIIICLHLAFWVLWTIFIRAGMELLPLTDGSCFICQCYAVRTLKCQPARQDRQARVVGRHSRTASQSVSHSVSQFPSYSPTTHEAPM